MTAEVRARETGTLRGRDGGRDALRKRVRAKRCARPLLLLASEAQSTERADAKSLGFQDQRRTCRVRCARESLGRQGSLDSGVTLAPAARDDPEGSSRRIREAGGAFRCDF